MRKIWLCIWTIFFMLGCSMEKVVEHPKVVVVKMATNLQTPWSIQKFGQTFFISERVGTIAHLKEDGTITHEKVMLTAPLSNVSESGLLGFVLKPDFAISNEAFAYYTYKENDQSYNRVVTLKREDIVWRETKIHLDAIPTGHIHHGGRLALSPDKSLYATVGDAGRPQQAQDLTLLNGKILRMKEDESFEVFSLGHRNPQGLAWDEKGTLFSSEHGQNANDEINQVDKGQNYGWPIIQGMEKKEGFVTPLLTSGTDKTWAPSGMTFHKGKLYVASLRGEAIHVIDVLAKKLEQSITGFGRIRDIFSDGDHLYFITNNTDGRGSSTNEDDILYKLEE